MKIIFSVFIGLLFCISVAAETLVNSNITSSQTWTLAGSPYIINGDLIIYGGSEPVVTVEAGVQIKFNSGSSLQIGSTSPGGIIVNGTAANPVLFTANTATPTPGFWECIRSANSSLDHAEFNYAIFEYGGEVALGKGIIDVNGGNPEFNHCTFRYSGTCAIWHTSNTSSAVVENCSFLNNASYPLYWNANQVEWILAGNSFSGNNPNRILLRSVNIQAGDLWLNQGIPFEAENSLIVRGNGTNQLLLSSGVQILFRAGKTLDVGYTSSPTYAGSINANGVTFGAVDPAAGWDGIDFQNYTEASLLANCTVRNVSSTSAGGIWLHNNNPVTIQNCLFEYIDDYALKCSSGAAFSLSGSTISHCAGTISIYARDLGNLGAGNQYLANSDNRIYCLGGLISSSSAWTVQGIPIYVSVNITYYSVTFPTLVIPYGTVLEFNSGVSFSVGYTSSASYGAILQATGVTFRGEAATPGYWGGLIFNRYGGPNILSGCTIRDAGYGNNPGLQISTPASTVTGCTITNCLATGVYFSDISLASLSGNFISGCGSYPLSLTANSVRVLGEGNDFTGNAIDRVEVRAEIINTSGIWRDPGVPYYITNDLNIYSVTPFPHIQIMPGTVIMLPNGAGISIGYPSSPLYQGSLSAESVTFTRSDGSAVPSGLYFDGFVVSEQCVFTDCTFQYLRHPTQNCAVYVIGSSPIFESCLFTNNPAGGIATSSTGRPIVNNCSFINNGGYPIKTTAAGFDVVSGVGNYFSGNNPNRILISGGILTQNLTWDNPSVPVEVTSDIYVYGTAFPILKINSGLVLLFQSDVGLTVGYGSSPSYQGGIQADGAKFSALSGITGGWDGLKMEHFFLTSSYIRDCVVEYAGSNGNIWVDDSALPAIESCVIRYGTYGIKLNGSNSTASIIRNYILDNATGIYCSISANPVIGGSLANANCIDGNTGYGVQNITSSVTVNAEYNWWGHDSGPYHTTANPSGQGDSVSNYVDFTPWRTTNIGDAPARFHLLAPASGSVVETLTPILDWEEAIDPTPGDTVTYTLEIARNSGFTTGLITVSGISASVYHVPAAVLTDDTRYYWRVKATDTQLQTTLSYENYFYFDTAVPEAPLPFDPLSPDYNEVVMFTSNLLAWETAVDPDQGDIVSYTVYMDDTAGFDTPEILTTSDTFIYSGFCAPGGLYFWKVKATDLTGNETFSPTWRFFVSPDAKPRAPVYFSLSAVGPNMLLSWDAVPGADSYSVYYSQNAETGFSLLQSGLTATEYTHAGAAVSARGFYYVMAIDTF